MKKIRNLTLPLAIVLSLGLGITGCGEESSPAAAQEAPAQEAPAGQRVEISVGASGYTPAEVQARSGQPLTLVFTRTTDEGCGQEIVIASQNIRRPLPLNEPVEITFTPSEAGRLRFTCGMDMYDGAIVVR